MRKTLIGPQLRQIRRKAGQTQAEMARRLGISAAYVNLLENNQRALSVSVLMALTEQYGLDMRSFVQDDDVRRLTDLRAAVRDPVFPGDAPDIAELRAATEHAPALVERFLHLYQSHRILVDQLQRLSGRDGAEALLRVTPETAIHDHFRDNRNHFPDLETAAETLRDRIGGTVDDMYTLLKRHLHREHGVTTDMCRSADMPDTLRVFDEDTGRVLLSEALDPINRIFQLAHVLGLLEAGEIVQDHVDSSAVTDSSGRARLRVELTNYFAAALLMPYTAFLDLARSSGYDTDRLAAAFGVSFEQVCHRLTTLQRDGDRGIPFFFIRVDRAGNVTKRFNATAFTLAEQGGACPVWDIHGAFRVPGAIVPQCVELPDGGRFFTLSRTADRPVFSHAMGDRSLVVAIGCEIRHAASLVYARRFNLDDPALFAPIGINCHVCPRQACSQRAHRPMHVTLPFDSSRRGRTRYES